MTPRQRLHPYLRLIRFDRPIGTFLLLWPTWWGLWLAAEGVPTAANLVIFTAGVFLMRSAGCIANDFADRDIDGHVERTRDRPLASGEVSEREAIGLGVTLALIAFLLVLLTNALTVKLSFAGLVFALGYPYLKRVTHLPQFGLGVAFSWGIPMAFAAERNELPSELWLVFIAALLWSVVYDTFYAMVDRNDDLLVGVRSTAILFGSLDRRVIGVLQVLVILLLWFGTRPFGLGLPFTVALVCGAGLFAWQQYLTRDRDREHCFRAFLNNNFFGVIVFAGIALDYLLR